jgi:hypothetical protein
VGDAPYGRRRDAAETEVISRPRISWRFACVHRGPLFAADKLSIGIGTYSYHSLSIDAMIAQLQRLAIREIEMSRGEVVAGDEQMAPASQVWLESFRRRHAEKQHCLHTGRGLWWNDRQLNPKIRRILGGQVSR